MEIDWVKYFKCKKCWEVKPLNKCYFHINTMFSTGFNSKCKSCVKEERESKPKVKYITRAELEEENKKLKEEISKYKKQYEHSMWDDEWKKRETVYVRNSEWDYVETQIWDRRFMEEDTLQELKDIWEL